MTGPRRTVDETAWWFAKAEATFAFLLRDFDAVIVERYFHFKGNYIDYQGPAATPAGSTSNVRPTGTACSARSPSGDRMARCTLPATSMNS